MFSGDIKVLGTGGLGHIGSKLIREYYKKMDNLYKNKVLITGGCGFLGSNLAKRLIDQKFEVILFINKDEIKTNIKEIEDRVKIIEGNLLNREDVLYAIQKVDYLFHFAWQTDLKESMKNPIKDLKNDVASLINILEICKESNPRIKIIFPSTVTLIGEASKIPSDEEEKENPTSVYDLHKLIAEKYLQMYYKIYKIKSCILRLSNVFGEGQKIDNPSRGVLNFMIGRALRGEELTVYGEGDFVRDYNYVDNYIDAFILAALSPSTNGKMFILGSGEGKTFMEVVERIREIVEKDLQKNVKITKIPFPEGTHEINKRNYIANSTKFRQTTGWYPKINFEEGLKKTIHFYWNS